MSPPNHRLSPQRHDRKAAAPPDPVQCIVGDTLCQVRVWTDEEWALLDPADRPNPAEHVPGLGWVGAVLRRNLI